MQEPNHEITPPSQYSRTVFEPGIHLEGGRAYELQQQIFRQIRQGDFSLNSWNTTNGELKKRLLTQNPVILSIDGSSFVHDVDNQRDMVFELSLLPFMPHEIGQESLFMVRSDLVGDIDLPDRIIDPDQLGMGVRLSEILPTTAEQALTLPIIWSALVAIEATSKVVTKGMTRREFLKRAGIAAAGFGIAAAGGLNASWQLPRISASQADPKTKDMWLSVMDIVKPRLLRVDSAHARTATVLMKHLDAIDALKLDKSTSGALVFGAEHGYNATEIMNDEDKRIMWVQKAGEIMASSLVQLHKSGKYVFDLNTAMIALFDYIPTYDVLKISEPQSGAKSLSDVLIDKVISPVKSPRVEKALAPVRKKFVVEEIR